jgi:hypothetical protein
VRSIDQGGKMKQVYQLGDEVSAVIKGTVTEIKASNERVRYCIESADYGIAFVYSEDIQVKGEEDAITNTEVSSTR